MSDLPELAWQPPVPRGPVPGIALIGCGGISERHLTGYRDAGWPVRVLCSRDITKAEAHRATFFPDAVVTTDWREAVARDDVGVVDATPHPPERVPIIEGAIEAGKHVLSQKPFVNDLATGERLCDLADARGVKLAVNQNGRWAPHMSWMRCAVDAGLVGEVTAVDVAIHWDHNWIAGTVFDDTPHLLLFDFGIHWFDFIHSLMGGRAVRATSASVRRSPTQRAKPPLIGEATICFNDARATLNLNGDSAHVLRNATTVTGTEGAIVSDGVDLQNQEVRLHRADRPDVIAQLDGQWFPDGFRGAMGDLLCAIEDDRAPLCSGRSNLSSLQLCWQVIDHLS